jgi:hypothetical protein
MEVLSWRCICKRAANGSATPIEVGFEPMSGRECLPISGPLRAISGIPSEATNMLVGRKPVRVRLLADSPLLSP